MMYNKKCKYIPSCLKKLTIAPTFPTSPAIDITCSAFPLEYFSQNVCISIERVPSPMVVCAKTQRLMLTGVG